MWRVHLQDGPNRSRRNRFGGASGLGAATACRLAYGETEVVVADLDAARGLSVADDADDVSAAVEAVRAAERGLRISVCCAGIGPPAKIVGREGAALNGEVIRLDGALRTAPR